MRLPFLFKLIINRYFFEKLAALALLGILMYALSSFLLVFLFTFLFAFLFMDLAKWLREKLTQVIAQIHSPAIRKALTTCNKFPVLITIIYVLFITVITAMFYSFIPHLIEETKGLIKLAPQITNQLRGTADNLQSQVSFNLGFDEFFDGMVSKANIETTLLSIFQNIKNAGVFLLQIMIALLLSFVFLIDREKIISYFSGIKEGNFAFIYEQFSNFAGKIANGFGLIFKAQAIIAFANAVLTTIGLLIIGYVHGGDSFPFIATIGILVFVMGFIPVFGFLISSVPIALIGFNYGGTDVLLMIALMTAVVHTAEAYYLNPKIVSSYMEFPVFITFLILLLSEHFMGFIGLLIGVPLFYILLDLAKDFNEYVVKIQKISNTIDTQKTTTQEAIHKNIRLSRSGKRGPE